MPKGVTNPAKPKPAEAPEIIHPVQYVDIDSITPHTHNPRKITDKQLNILIQSLTDDPDVFESRPILINKDRIIIAGNMRWRAAKKLGMLQIPVVQYTNKTPEQERRIMMKDNINNGDWDWQAITDDGWSFEELENMGMDMSAAPVPTTKKGAQDDNFTKDTVLNPISKLGDLYELISTHGTHRIICGDSTDPDVMGRLMMNRQADMVFTDPPYNVDYHAKQQSVKKATGNTGSNTTDTEIANDHMDKAAFEAWLTQAFKTLRPHLKLAAACYVCHASSTQREFENALNEAGLEIKQQIIWVKNSFVFGFTDYKWMHEPIFYASLQKKKCTFYGQTNDTTVWEDSWTPEQAEKNLKRLATKLTAGGSTIWKISRDSKAVHPTQKPVRLVAKAIENSSKEGDIIVDQFAGSGTTLITAEQLWRNCYTAEILPVFVDLIVTRYAMWKQYKSEDFQVFRNGNLVTNLQDYLEG